MNPPKYLVMPTRLEAAKVAEFLGRCYADHWLERSLATTDESDPPQLKQPWQGQPFAHDWIVIQGNAHYPVPPDVVYGGGQPGPAAYTHFYSEA